MRRVLFWVLGCLVGLIVVAVVGFWIYANVGVMAAEPKALAAVNDNSAVTLTDEGDAWVMAPASGSSEVGLVFIPGAKVEPVAYAATLVGVVEAGATVVITKPTLNLALFDLRPLDAFTDLAPDVDDWAVGGHSLGGVRACQLAQDADGLVLFGSYCVDDLASTDLDVLSISASKDGLSTPDEIESRAELLPADTTFVVIEGGNHAGFGAYGVQPGDGQATIDETEMRSQITDALGAFLFGE